MKHNENDDWQIPPTPGAISIEKISPFQWKWKQESVKRVDRVNWQRWSILFHARRVLRYIIPIAAMAVLFNIPKVSNPCTFDAKTSPDTFIVEIEQFFPDKDID